MGTRGFLHHRGRYLLHIRHQMSRSCTDTTAVHPPIFSVGYTRIEPAFPLGPRAGGTPRRRCVSSLHTRSGAIVPTDGIHKQAHAMTPHLAGGASQAIEDAYILGEIFGRVFTAGSGAVPSASLLEHAFKIYEQVRLPLANSVLMKSRDNGRMYCLSYPGCRPEDLFERDQNGKVQLGTGNVERMEKIFNAQWSWAWTTTIEDDRDRAMRLLDELLSSHVL